MPVLQGFVKNYRGLAKCKKCLQAKRLHHFHGNIVVWTVTHVRHCPAFQGVIENRRLTRLDHYNIKRLKISGCQIHHKGVVAESKGRNAQFKRLGA